MASLVIFAAMTRWAPVALLLLVPAVAGAQRRLAVVDPLTPTSMVGLGSEVVNLVSEEAEKQGYKVVGPEEIREKLGEDKYQELLKCEDNGGCISAKLSAFKIEHAVTGSLNRDERNYLLKLRLVDVGSARVINQVDRPILIAARRFRQDVQSAIPELLRGEHEAMGQLSLTSPVNGAQVSVDGEVKGTTPLTLPLRPGKHEVTAEKSGYQPLRRLFTVEAKQTTQEELRLIPVPGAQDSSAPSAGPSGSASTPTATGVAQSHPSHPQLVVPVGAWVLLGAAVAATGVGVVFGIQSNNSGQRIQQSYDSDSQTYGATRNDALKNQQQARTADYCFIGAGAALVGSVVWTYVATLSNSKSDSVHASLSMGKDGAGMLVQGSF